MIGLIGDRWPQPQPRLQPYPQPPATSHQPKPQLKTQPEPRSPGTSRSHEPQHAIAIAPAYHSHQPQPQPPSATATSHSLSWGHVLYGCSFTDMLWCCDGTPMLVRAPGTSTRAPGVRNMNPVAPGPCSPGAIPVATGLHGSQNSELRNGEKGPSCDHPPTKARICKNWAFFDMGLCSLVT